MNGAPGVAHPPIVAGASYRPLYLIHEPQGEDQVPAARLLDRAGLAAHCWELDHAEPWDRPRACLWLIDPRTGPQPVRVDGGEPGRTSFDVVSLAGVRLDVVTLPAPLVAA